MSIVRRGRRHQVTLDGQTVWLDSDNEEIALRRFIDDYRFSGNWLRPMYGVKRAGKYYSPDFELAVDDNGNTSLALIEVKQYKKDFTSGILKRICVISNHYHTNYLYLYVIASDSWHRIDKRRLELIPCTAPLPGRLAISELARPKTLKVKNPYGRHYNQSYTDIALAVLGKALRGK